MIRMKKTWVLGVGLTATTITALVGITLNRESLLRKPGYTRGPATDLIEPLLVKLSRLDPLPISPEFLELWPVVLEKFQCPSHPDSADLAHWLRLWGANKATDMPGKIRLPECRCLKT
jgi:hypothetical protein